MKIGSNTSVIGKQGSCELYCSVLWDILLTYPLALTGIGLRVLNENNVIIRNVKIAKVLAPGDNIGIQAANQVWVDHCDLSSDRDHDKDL